MDEDPWVNYTEAVPVECPVCKACKKCATYQAARFLEKEILKNEVCFDHE